MERIGRDMDDLRKKMETFIKNNGRLNEQNPKTEAEEAGGTMLARFRTLKEKDYRILSC